MTLVASDPAALRPLPRQEARDNLARAGLVYALAMQDLARPSQPPFTLPEAAEALELAARDMTAAVDAEPPLRKPRGWDR